MSQIDVQRAKESLRDAKDDLEKLDQLSNQFRTCMVIVAAPPSGSLSGDPEIKIFMEQQKSRIEPLSLEEVVTWIDVLQSHLILYSRRARELSKTKIKIDVEERAAKAVKERDSLRERKRAKLAGETHVIKESGEVPINRDVLNPGVEPVDKATHKAIQGIRKVMTHLSYAQAKAMIEGMQITKKEEIEK